VRFGRGMVVALRGLRSRAVLTLGCVLLATIGVASAVLGPAYLNAATNSIVVDRLESAAVTSAGLAWRLDPTERDPETALADARRAADARAPSEFDPARAFLVTDRYATTWKWHDSVEAGLMAVDDGCARLIVSGRCPQRPYEVLVADVDVKRGGFPVGSRVPIGAGLPPMVVVGSYRLKDPQANWFDPSWFVSVPPAPPEDPTYHPARFLTVPESFAELPLDQWWVQVDRRLRVEPSLTPERADQLATIADAERARGDVKVPGGTLRHADQNGLRDIVDSIESERQIARDTVLPAALSLSLVALLLLLRLLGESADLRRPEFALLSLRGWSRRRLWLFGLAEPAMVLLIAIPLGGFLGWRAADLLIDAWLHPGLPHELPLGSLVAAGAVLVAGLAAASLALVRVMREELRVQLEATSRPRPLTRTELVVQVTIVVAAVLDAYLVAGRAGRGAPGLTDLLVPVLLALAGGLIGVQLTVLLARRMTRRTQRRRRLATYLSARRLARRREGALVVLPVAVALGVGVFAVGVDAAANTWREGVATSRVGADLAYSTNLTPEQTLSVTNRVDPDGQWLMTAVVVPASTSADAPPLVAIDATREAAVGQWADGLGAGSNASAIADLLAPHGEPPQLRGRQLAVDLTNDLDVGDDLSVTLQLRDFAARVHERWLSTPEPADQVARASIPYCDRGCSLVGLSLGGIAGSPDEMRGEVIVHGLTVDGRPVDIGLADRGSWRASRPYPGDNGASVVSAQPTGDGLRMTVDSSDRSVLAAITPTDVPDVRPVLATSDIRMPAADHAEGALGLYAGSEGLYVPVKVVGVAEALPFVGRTGVMIDLTSYLREASVSQSQDAATYVLARDGMPAAMADRLTAAGVSLDQPLSLAAERETLDNDAYALSLRLYLIVSVVLLALALAGVTAHLIVGMPGRRRDAAALRVVGVSRRTVARASLVELAITLGVAALAGVIAGVVAQWVILGKIRLGTADSKSPDIPARIDLASLGAYTAATAVVLLIVAGLVARATVRRARAAELRESAR
jgi:putative ABC transport system permease protein